MVEQRYVLGMLSLWLNKGMFWVSEQRLVDQANTIRRNSWMTELEIEELERNLAENDSWREKEKSNDDASSNLGEMRDILAVLEADEDIVSLEEEEVAIIEEIVEALERRQKKSYQLLETNQRRSS